MSSIALGPSDRPFGDHLPGCCGEFLEMRVADMGLEGGAVVVDLVEEDMRRRLLRGADVELMTPGLFGEGGARVVEHQRHELGQTFRVDDEFHNNN